MSVCRVIIQPDGTVWTNHPAPGVTIEDAWARLIEVDESPDNPNPVGLRGLAYFDADNGDLPPETAVCDECGEHHNIRDQWRAVHGRVIVDPSVPNPSVIARHLVLAEDRELWEPEPDAIFLARVASARRQLASGRQPPDAWIDAVRQRLGRRKATHP